MSAKRKPYTVRLQVVCSLALGVAPLESDEVPALEEAVRSGSRSFQCDVLSTRAGRRWLELLLATPPGFDVARALTSLKAVTSRAMHVKRGGDSGFWSQGYAVVSVGDPIDPEEAASKLENSGTKK